MPGDGHCIANYLAVHFEEGFRQIGPRQRPWQSFRQMGHRTPYKYTKV